MKGIVPTGVAIALWLATLALLARPPMQLWQASLIVCLVASGVWVAGYYRSNVRRIHELALLQRPSWLHRVLLNGHYPRLAAVLIAAPLTGMAVAVDLAGLGNRAMAWIATDVLIAGLAAALLWPRLANWRPLARPARVLFAACLVAAALTAVARVLAGGMEVARYAGPSRLLGESVDLLATWSLMKDWAEGYLPAAAVTALHLLGGFGYYFAVAFAASGVGLLASGDARRLWSLQAESPPPPRPGQLGWAAFWFAAVLMLALQVSAQAEATLSRIPAQVALSDPGGAQEPAPIPILPSEVRSIVEADRVDNQICPPGTAEAVRIGTANAEAFVRARQSEVRQTVHAMYDRARTQVPPFLDHYYSLQADYLRTLNLLTGDGAAYLEAQIAGALTPKGDFTAFQKVLDEVQASAAEAKAGRWVGVVASGCGLEDPDVDYRILDTADTGPLTASVEQLVSVAENASRFERRALASGTAGLAGGVAAFIGSRIALKTAGKTGVKLAAEALVKLGAKKAASFGSGFVGGAVLGGTGGSVVPGAGTAAGALVFGLAGGFAVMLGVDLLALKLEEEISRDDFQADLMQAIDEAEAELLTTLGL